MKPASSVFDRRRAGVLLHVTSLPGEYGNGDLGSHAHRFVEFLAKSGLSVWQTLPLGPTHEDLSPYQCLSAHAGNPLLISLDWLAARGWLKEADLAPANSAQEQRYRCLKKACAAFKNDPDPEIQRHYQSFVQLHRDWLDDYALFIALKGEFKGRPWQEWPAAVRDRHKMACAAASMQLAKKIAEIKFEQFVFFQQWHELKAHARQHAVLLFGDMPIFVASDSAEVWAHREYFCLDEKGQPRVVAGVPPDYFSETGQRWGNPHYAWERMQTDDFSWWIKRLHTQLELFDWVRIDHFRGFESYWEIPAELQTATHGRWVKAPGEALLDRIYETFDTLPLIAENLGTITPEVEALRAKYGLPGMLILQFAFDGGPSNPYLPHHHEANNVVYTGTHDNDTTLAWFESLNREQQNYILDYLGRPQNPMPWPLVQCTLASVARLAMLPMQDLLGLGRNNRMNTPGTQEGNWRWRFSWDQLSDDRIAHLSRLIRLYDRDATI